MGTAKTAAAVLAAFCALALAGCGGGGSSSNDGSGGPGSGNSGALIGKVVDASGNPVPGATVRADTGATAATLSQGGYQIASLTPGVHRVTASLSENGTNYTGSTQALVVSDTTVSNAVIAVAPANQQATVYGTVRDQSGRALPGVRVFVGVFATSGSTGAGGSVSGLVAFTDNGGNYQMANVPAPVTQYTADASAQGYQNSRVTLSALQAGESRRQDFTLSGSFGQSVLTPTNVQAFSFTQPSAILLPNARKASASASPASAYERIHRALSPAYARRAASERGSPHASARKMPHASGGFGAYAIQMDVFFDNAQPDSLSGFRIYNSAGQNPPTPYDFLQDPLADYYTDLDPFYVAGQQYNFAASGISTDGTESGISPASSVVPLDLLQLAQPQSGQTVGNPVVVAWSGVSGAASYSVFLYPAFPGVGVSGTQYDAGGATSYTLPGLPSGDWWVVVAAGTSDGSAVSVSPIVEFHVP